MIPPTKPALRKALEQIVRISEESLLAANALPVRAAQIAPVVEGHALILGIAKAAIGGQAWGGKPARRA